ncbi:MAG: recombinase family protein [Dehalococcoidia bacterium]
MADPSAVRFACSQSTQQYQYPLDFFFTDNTSVVLYAREVSRDPVEAVESQLQHLGRFAMLRDWEIQAAFVDVGSAAQKEDPAKRPAFKEMLELLRYAAVDFVLVETEEAASAVYWDAACRKVRHTSGNQTLLSTAPVSCDVVRRCSQPVRYRSRDEFLGGWILSCPTHGLWLRSRGLFPEPLPAGMALAEQLVTSGPDSDRFAAFEATEPPPDDVDDLSDSTTGTVPDGWSSDLIDRTLAAASDALDLASEPSGRSRPRGALGWKARLSSFVMADLIYGDARTSDEDLV